MKFTKKFLENKNLKPSVKFLFILTYLFSFSETLTLIFLEEKLFIFCVTLVFLIIVLIFQLLLIYSINYNYFIISFIVAFNFISLKIMYLNRFLTLDKFDQSIFFIFVWIASFIVFRNYKENKPLKIIINSSLIFLIFVSIFFNSYSVGLSKSGINKDGLKKFSKSITNEDQETKYYNIFKKINLIDKPDIYIISFDSVGQDEFYKKYFKIKNIPYSKRIIKNNGRVFKNTFVMEILTKPSINATLMLDMNKKNSFKKFSGVENSLLFSILKKNGYKISTGYSGNYLGKFKGQFVDSYITSGDNLLYSNICLVNYSLFASFIPRFLGICEIRNLFFNKEKIKYMSPVPETVDPQKILNKNLQKDIDGNFKTWQQKTLNHIKKLNNNLDETWFSFLHLHRPIGHADDGHNSSKESNLKYINEVYNPQSKLLAQMIEKFLNILKFSKKDYLLIIISDNGPLLTNKDTNDKLFYNLDRHGIFAASIGNKNFCSEHFQPFRSYVRDSTYKHTNEKFFLEKEKSFTSPGRIIMGLIHCLSDEKSKDLIKSNANFNTSMKFEELLID